VQEYSGGLIDRLPSAPRVDFPWDGRFGAEGYSRRSRSFFDYHGETLSMSTGLLNFGDHVEVWESKVPRYEDVH
jgi:hypothetical protein